MKTQNPSAPQELAPAPTLCTTDLATIVRLPQLTKMVGISRSMIYLKINAKSRYFDAKFPKPIRLGQKAIGWLLSDIYDYIRALKSQEHSPNMGH